MRIRQLAILLIALLACSLISLAQNNPTGCAPSATCLVAAVPKPEGYSLETVHLLANSDGLVPVQAHMAHLAGPLSHKWVQFGTGQNAITFGYGAANIPLVDSGQVIVTYKHGVELVSPWHILPGHFTRAELPDRGRTIGPPVYITVAKAQKLIREQRRRRFVFPYIPLFHDCHTYVCSLMAQAEGKSSLPCYLWFKGHF